MSKINVGGRELALLFTMRALCSLDEVLGEPIDVETIPEKLNMWLKNPRTLMKIAALLAEEGEAAEGRVVDAGLEVVTVEAAYERIYVFNVFSLLIIIYFRKYA